MPGPTDVVVQVAAAGVCGTDLHFLSGELDLPFPFTPGHEVAGEVVAVGREVRTHVVGDRVAVDPALPCHVCAACRAARDNQCTDRQGIGETRDGGCADLVLVPATNAIHLPEGSAPPTRRSSSRSPARCTASTRSAGSPRCSARGCWSSAPARWGC
ncbi:hypothetical protein GCM10025868_21130 [Angustibacter aerolatus]|uniref:Alcohol dehydrogenase-like N-terminal domain-containing protein n=1 Tax=Angustibacter aerolatus TaxID=1162965 RepID=A0ABQ6JFB6_9ACTN|nr:hypothetical protein GCM10025868_21130 [Angustibacter aerolatus]